LEVAPDGRPLRQVDRGAPGREAHRRMSLGDRI
jgi:hypothetical protein